MSNALPRSIDEFVADVCKKYIRELRVAMPGIIQSYDATTQLASVQPCLSEKTFLIDGTPEVSQLPQITNIPVAFPGSGNFTITFPITKGDTCLLVFADRSLDAWTSDGKVGAAGPIYTHNITDAICIPGLRPSGGIADVSVTKMTLGVSDGEAKALARIDKIQDRLNKIETIIKTKNAVQGAPLDATIVSTTEDDLACDNILVKD